MHFTIIFKFHLQILLMLKLMGYDQQAFFYLNKEISLGNYLKDRLGQRFKPIRTFCKLL